MPLNTCCGRRKKTKSPGKDVEIGRVASTSDQASGPSADPSPLAVPKFTESPLADSGAKEHPHSPESELDHTSAVKSATPNVEEGTRVTESLNQESRKDRTTRILKRVAALGWQGFKLSLDVLSVASDSIPLAGSVISGLQAVIDIYDRVDSNKYAAKASLERLNGLLETLGYQIQEYGISREVETCIKKLSDLFTEVEEMQNANIALRAVNSGDDEAELERLCKAIDAAIEALEVELSFDTRATTKDIQQDLTLDKLPLATTASHTATSDKVSRGSCTKETRVQILENILAWACDPAAPSVFWLSGLAGQGKTTIAYSVCERLGDRSAARQIDHVSYFCSRQLDSGKSKLLVPTLVSALAKVPSLSSFASKVAIALRATDNLGHQNVGVQMRKLFVEPWQQSARFRAGPPVVIVIDGLDENKAGIEFIQELFAHIEQLPGLRFFCTSRPDLAFRTSFEALRARTIDLNPPRGSEEFSMVNADIKRYIRSVLPTQPETEDVVEALAGAADGLFVFAATVIRAAVGRTRRSEKEMFGSIRRLVTRADRGKDTAPRGTVLDQLYAEIISSAFAELDDETANNRQRVLLVLLELSRIHPIPPWFLGRVATNDDEKLATIVVESLHSVLYIEKNSGNIFTYHASFEDYIAARPSSLSPSPLLTAATTALRFVYDRDPQQRSSGHPDDTLRTLIPFPRDPNKSEEAVLDWVYDYIFAVPFAECNDSGKKTYIRFLQLNTSLGRVHEVNFFRVIIAEWGPTAERDTRNEMLLLRHMVEITPLADVEAGSGVFTVGPSLGSYIARRYPPPTRSLLSLPIIEQWWDFVDRWELRANFELHESSMPALPSSPSELAFEYLQFDADINNIWRAQCDGQAPVPVPQQDELSRLRSQYAAKPDVHHCLELCNSLRAFAQWLRHSGQLSEARAIAAENVSLANTQLGPSDCEGFDVQIEEETAFASAHFYYALCLTCNQEYTLAKDVASKASLHFFRIWSTLFHNAVRRQYDPAWPKDDAARPQYDVARLQYVLALHLHAFASQSE